MYTYTIFSDRIINDDIPVYFIINLYMSIKNWSFFPSFSFAATSEPKKKIKKKRTLV